MSTNTTRDNCPHCYRMVYDLMNTDGKEFHCPHCGKRVELVVREIKVFTLRKPREDSKQ